MILVYLSIALTIAHTLDEVRGNLLEYLNRNAGAKISRDLGWLLIGVVTPLLAIGAAYYGYWSVLIGMRVGDAVLTHIGPRIVFWRQKNPGLMSAPLYLGEAWILYCLVDVPMLDLFIGASPFILLWPLLWSNGE